MAMPAWVSEVGVAAQIAGVAATVTIAALAVWGERIRALFLKPKLRLQLRNEFGELTDQHLLNKAGNVVGVLPARYYHLRVTNETHFPAAHEVLVYLTRVEKPGPDGDPQTLYETDLPLSWMHPQLYRTPDRTSGALPSQYVIYFSSHPIASNSFR